MKRIKKQYVKEQMLGLFKQISDSRHYATRLCRVYASNIAYGMFAARLPDPTLDNFSRQEAAELIPKSNPFCESSLATCRTVLTTELKWLLRTYQKFSGV